MVGEVKYKKRFVPGVFNDVGFKKGIAEDIATPLFVERNELAQ